MRSLSWNWLLMQWGQDIVQPQPQAETSFSDHRGTSITTLHTLPFLWETTYCFQILFCPRAPILNCHESPGTGFAKWQICTTAWGDTSQPQHAFAGTTAHVWSCCTAQQCMSVPSAVPSAAQSLHHPSRGRSPARKTCNYKVTAGTKARSHMEKLLRVSLLCCCVLRGPC